MKYLPVKKLVLIRLSKLHVNTPVVEGDCMYTDFCFSLDHNTTAQLHIQQLSFILLTVITFKLHDQIYLFTFPSFFLQMSKILQHEFVKINYSFQLPSSFCVLM